MSYPKDFIWGAATSAHQMRRSHRRWKGLSIWDSYAYDKKVNPIPDAVILLMAITLMRLVIIITAFRRCTADEGDGAEGISLFHQLGKSTTGWQRNDQSEGALQQAGG